MPNLLSSFKNQPQFVTIDDSDSFELGRSQQSLASEDEEEEKSQSNSDQPVRGRPRRFGGGKQSKVKKSSKVTHDTASFEGEATSSSESDRPVKRRFGRPRGSKNIKARELSQSEEETRARKPGSPIKRRPGRPRRSCNRRARSESPEKSRKSQNVRRSTRGSRHQGKYHFADHLEEDQEDGEDEEDGLDEEDEEDEEDELENSSEAATTHRKGARKRRIASSEPGSDSDEYTSRGARTKHSPKNRSVVKNLKLRVGERPRDEHEPASFLRRLCSAYDINIMALLCQS